jgi:hypothetical protein
MKVSMSDDDTIVIQCERFEAGKEDFSWLIPQSIEIVYLFLFLIIFCFSSFNLLDFFLKHNHQLCRTARTIILRLLFMESLLHF